MSARKILFVFFALALSAGAAAAEVHIEKVAKKGAAARVDFVYTNDSDSTLSLVKIVCAPPGAESRREKGTVYLSNHFGGGIPPGHTQSGSVRVPLPEGAKPEDIGCTDEGRALIVR